MRVVDQPRPERDHKQKERRSGRSHRWCCTNRLGDAQELSQRVFVRIDEDMAVDFDRRQIAMTSAFRGGQFITDSMVGQKTDDGIICCAASRRVENNFHGLYFTQKLSIYRSERAYTASN